MAVEPKVIKRLMREKATFVAPPYTNAAPRDGNLRVWDAVIIGAPGTPYENGKFSVKLEFPMNYPLVPPKVTWKTRIYHCNINTNGNVCLNVLKSRSDGGSWTPAMDIRGVLLSLQQLLGDPNPADPLMDSVAQQMITNKEEHDRLAKLWTQRYAKK